MRSLIRAAASAAALLVAGAAVVAGCASAGPPPGGPERHVPPEIVSVSVDSGETNVKVKTVEFKFDEVVSDRPAGGATGLDQIFLISPRNGDPRVAWHRTHIDVRPKNGFKPNTAYRITMLPGLVDLRNNVRKDTRTLLFSTGPTFPPFTIHGLVFDWAVEKTATGAYVEATSLADTSVVYVTATDTIGVFDVGPLPAGAYRVRALIDKNNNRALDRGEKWDTTTVTITTVSPVVELDAIERDSTPPVLEDVNVIDSTTLRFVFDKPLDPALPITPALVRVIHPDSTPLQILATQRAGEFDRALKVADSTHRADSLRAIPVDSAAAAARRARQAALAASGQRPPPPPARPRSFPPDRGIIVRLSPVTPVLVGAHYIAEAHGVRNLVGNARDSRRPFEVPKPAPKKPPVDSTRRVRPDSTRRARTDTARLRDR